MTERTFNFDAPIPSFEYATTSEVIVTATKDNDNEDANVELEVTDVAGNVCKCEVDHFRDSEALVGIQTPSGETKTIILHGPTAVFVDLSSLADTDGDGLEQVETELIQLELAADSGIALKLRSETSDPSEKSTGEIEENYNAGTGTLDLAPFVSKNACPGGCTAGSFFDVFFEVDVPGVGTLHNHDSLKIEATINHKPPGTETTYTKPEGTDIALYYEWEEDSEFNLVDAKHSPTAVEIISFTANAVTDGSVTLTWETATEIDNAGFNIYRAKHKNGAYIRVNSALIPAKGNATLGAYYSFVDTPGNGTYYYKLEDIDTYGVSAMHGPVNVRVRSAEGEAKRRR